MDDLLRQFVLLWAVIDPIGSVPVFLAVARSPDVVEQRRLAFAGVGIAAGVLIFFTAAGQILLESMEIPLPAFQVAGGIVLFLFALTMIFGESKPEEEIHMVEKGLHTAVFPLAIPAIASPGAMMAAVMLTDNHRYALGEQAVTVALMLAVLAIQLAVLLSAAGIRRWIGLSGTSVISRIMGLILASVATDAVLSGIQAYFGLAGA